MQLQDLTSKPGRVLLINTHAIDIRLPWYKWHQPTGLLQLGASMQRQGCDVRFIDCLGWDHKERAPKRKVGKIPVNGFEFDLWRYGGLWGHLDNYIYMLKGQGWKPDQVYVSCSQTTWWQAAQALISRLRKKWFRDVEVILGGVYPSLEPEHAAKHSGADRIVVGPVAEARDEIPDFTLYDPNYRPRFAGIYLYKSQSVSDVETGTSIVPRDPGEIANEIAEKAEMGVTEFAFYDEEIYPEHRDHFLKVLRKVARLDIKARFVTIGNISSALIDGTVARWMGKAGYRQVFLKCDVTHGPDGLTYDTSYEMYKACVDALHRETGFGPRTEEITAMLLIGAPYENIEAVTERLIRLASIVGAVNLVQYQYSANTNAGQFYISLFRSDNEDPHLLTYLNCKFYPLARASGIPFEYYIELTRLAALLNSKYRSKTFDFLGNSLIARAVQNSLYTRGWSPLAKPGAEEFPSFIPLIPVERAQVDRDDRQTRNI